MNMTTTERNTMNGKPVHFIDAKSVLNLDSGFKHKLLCDGPTFSMGTACAYSCSFCYVPDAMRKSPHLLNADRTPRFQERHEDMVIRRKNGVELLQSALMHKSGKRRFADPNDQRVIYASPLVDVAANIVLCDETVEACKLILELTNWQIRLLSKSHLLPRIAEALERDNCGARERIIYGVSTGTLDDKLASAFEQGTALVSKRIKSLHWLQDNGFRTFGMICPSLPQSDYATFAKEMEAAIRGDRLEHVWAEVLNVRGESMVNTVKALTDAGYDGTASALTRVSTDKAAWEDYSRDTFRAHAALYEKEKLRFLQYVTNATREYWTSQVENGAVLL